MRAELRPGARVAMWFAIRPAPATPFKDAAHLDAQRLAKEISDTFLAKTTAYAEIWLDGQRLNHETDRRRADLRRTLSAEKVQNRYRDSAAE